MKTVSEYLLKVLKPHLLQLSGVAKTSLELMLKEYPIFTSSGDISTSSEPPDIVIAATLYSVTKWEGQLMLDVGSLVFRSCSRKEFPVCPSELEVTWLAKPGKETHDILQILKDSFK